MKGMMPVKGYQQNIANQPHEVDFREVLQTITPLTKTGALCFVVGKVFGLLAITAVFVPALNIIAIPMVICWGGLVLTTIVLCSYDHFVVSKRRSKPKELDAAEVQTWLASHPELTEQIISQIQTETDIEKEKVVGLSSYRN